MRELSIFVDESGSDGLSDRHYLLTVVMRDQSNSIADSIRSYESAFHAEGLPDNPVRRRELSSMKSDGVSARSSPQRMPVQYSSSKA